jgi:hypothetical protein
MIYVEIFFIISLSLLVLLAAGGLWALIRYGIALGAPRSNKMHIVDFIRCPFFFGFYDCLLLDEPDIKVIINTKEEQVFFWVKYTKFTTVRTLDSKFHMNVEPTDSEADDFFGRSENYKTIMRRFGNICLDYKNDRIRSKTQVKRKNKIDVTHLTKDLKNSELL